MLRTATRPWTGMALGLLTILVGSWALAEEPKPGAKKEGGDNPVLTQLLARFDAWDTNKDGFLDKEELTKALGETRAARTLQLYDKNGDGKISREEYTAWAKAYAQELKTRQQGDRPREGGRRG